MKILICGDRHYTDAKLIYKWMEHLPKDTIIIQGSAKGADTIAWVLADILSLQVEDYPADWGSYGKSAGPRRNKQMLLEGKPDLVVWFHKNIDNSKGTANMISQAEAAGIAVVSGEMGL